MVKLIGYVYDDVDLQGYSYTVDGAVVTKDRIALDWMEEGAKLHLLAHSKDGGNTYSGTFGTPIPDKHWKMELARYTSVNGVVLLIARWFKTDSGDEGCCAFELAKEWE